MTDEHSERPPQLDLFHGGSEMGALMRATDWSRTKLGPVEHWPPSLRTMLGVVLGSGFPMLLWWGPDLLNLYNDACRSILRDKHPDALAAAAAEVWADVWDVAGPIARSVQKGEPATRTEDLQLFIKSGTMAEETYLTFSYSPVPGDDGRVGGILNIVQETTAKVQSERQIRMLSELAQRGADATSEDEAYHIAADILSTNELDLPFALCYVLNEKGDGATLVTASGWRDYEGPAKPARVQIDGAKGGASWPFAEAIGTGREVRVDDLGARFGSLPIGTWNARPESAVVLPLSRSADVKPCAFLVAGLSPHRTFDERYQRFFTATADRVADVVASARAKVSEKKRADALDDVALERMRHRWVKELERTSRELEAVNKELDAFSYSVSHDLRAPLRAVTGFTNILLEDYRSQLPPEARELLDDIDTAGRGMEHLVEELMRFSRLARQPLSRQRVNVGTLVHDVLKGLAQQNPDRRADLEVRALPDVVADSSLLTVVFTNLLSNAFKFTKHKDPAIIEVGGRRENDAHVFFVRDNGVGFDMQYASRLFGVFQRLHGQQEFAGTGVGLSLVQRIVHRHGGRVWAEAEVGRGATFSFSLPD